MYRAILTLFLVSVCAFGASKLKAGIDKPNIIVFYTDDHGYADLSCQGILKDIKTPHIDRLAASGVLARHGYSTAPQCVPSRAGLLTGRFQSKFGLETNKDSLKGFNEQLTIAERLKATGYITAQFGKWHLGPVSQITDHGFKHAYPHNVKTKVNSNITLQGEDKPFGLIETGLYHIDSNSLAAANIIKRYKDKPFFLYIAYRAPHVPLDATKKYLDRFPGEMPERRRQALAMMSAVDDGVGLITKTLAEHKLTEKTLIFFIGDNGAPLKIHKQDLPGGGPGWDGSLNDPLNGEKGMLSEGGIHVPFVVSWPGTIPGGQNYEHAITALDVAATSLAIANIKVKAESLDGKNLLPHLKGEVSSPPHETLYWRWMGQAAIREGKWKLLIGGDRHYLFDLESDLKEKNNLMSAHPEIADRLKKKLLTWTEDLTTTGLSTDLGKAEQKFDFYLDGKTPPPLQSFDAPKRKKRKSKKK